MNLLFAAIGAFVGGVLGNLSGAFAMAVAGALAGWWWSAHRATARDDPSDIVDSVLMRRRLDALEKEVAVLRQHVEEAAPCVAPSPRATAEALEPPIVQPTPAVAASAPLAAPRIAPPPPVPLRDRLPPFLARWIFGGNTIVKVGVLILFLGLAFLLRYTAERVTLPVEWRYAGVAGVGVVLTTLGWRLRTRRDGYGLILQGAGIGVFYLTTLGTLRLEPLLPPGLAFGFMALVAVCGALLAVLQDAPWLSLVAVAEGFAAPVLVSTGSGADYVLLMSYMGILDIGILAMAWFKAWRPLNLVGAVATFALAGAWAQAHYVAGDRAGVQAFLLLFFLLFTVTGVLFARRALAAGDGPPAQAPLSERAVDALRQVGRVDSTLTFGVPLAAFSLQYLLVRDQPWGPAWAAAGFALFHILLGGVLMRTTRPRYALLGEAHVIVGTIFATLAVPLALQGVWTGATWAVEAAGMYWLGLRQHRTYARAFALAVMLGAALRLVTGLAPDLRPGAPLVNGSALGMALLAVALAALDATRRRLAANVRNTVDDIAATTAPSAAACALATLAWMLLPVPGAGAATTLIGLAAAALGVRRRSGALVGSGFALQVAAGVASLCCEPSVWNYVPAGVAIASTLWIPLLLSATGLCLGDLLRAAQATGRRAWWHATATQWAVVAWVLAWWARTLPPLVWHLLQASLPGPDTFGVWPHWQLIWVTLTALAAVALARLRDWRVLGQATLATVPAWILMTLHELGGVPPSAHLGWLAWPLALAAHPLLGRLQARWRPAPAGAALQVAGWWLFIALATLECVLRVQATVGDASPWCSLAGMAVPAAVLVASAQPALWRRFGDATQAIAWRVAGCAALALWLLAWLWVGNTGPGDAAPLPWVPLLNPLEIGQGIALLALLGWVRSVPAGWRDRAPPRAWPVLAGVTAFALVTGLVLRTCHHWAGVAWSADALYDSTLAQAALSVTWTSIGVALMVSGHRSGRRVPWGVGAALLGLVVAKLFLVELADRGTLSRIVSFTVVGGLMLAVGYFAPIPPRRTEPALPGDTA